MAQKKAATARKGKGGDFQPRRRYAFTAAGSLLSARLREASGRRGIAETRLLTEWEAVAGPEIAALCEPVRITHRRQALGGALVLLARPGRGPELEMMTPAIRERVNACYGYCAIGEIRITQTAPTGFSESGRGFDRSGAPSARRPQLSAEECAAVGERVRDVGDDSLRAALDRLGRNIAIRHKATEKKGQTR